MHCIIVPYNSISTLKNEVTQFPLLEIVAPHGDKSHKYQINHVLR